MEIKVEEILRIIERCRIHLVEASEPSLPVEQALPGPHGVLKGVDTSRLQV